MLNVHDAHRPFYGSQEEQSTYTLRERATTARPSKAFTLQDVRSADVPGYLPDLPGVRRELAQYLSSCRRADDTLAAVLAALDGSGQAGDTIVVVLSDNGMAQPFAKTNCYPRSTRTPLVVRWPGVTRRGLADTRHFASTLDLFPTLCRAAGATPPRDLDGTDLTPLLAGSSDQRGRDRVHTVFHETSAGERYEMRATQDERWCYIWNGWSDGRREFRTESMRGLAWRAMEAAAATDPSIAARTDFFRYRAPEELYDLHQDPDARINLAGPRPPEPPEARAALRRHREATSAWMRRTGDPLRERYHETIVA
jgi:N-sulfoglucosamine sulfohydrolase